MWDIQLCENCLRISFCCSPLSLVLVFSVFWLTCAFYSLQFFCQLKCDHILISLCNTKDICLSYFRKKYFLQESCWHYHLLLFKVRCLKWGQQSTIQGVGSYFFNFLIWSVSSIFSDSSQVQICHFILRDKGFNFFTCFDEGHVIYRLKREQNS